MSVLPQTSASDPAPKMAQSAAPVTWLARIEALCDADGYIQPLGPKHWAMFIEDSPEIIVSFERLEDILARPDQLPLGYELARAQGWSHLCLIADGETWYRDGHVYRYFDRLVDDAFFEDFDQVLFFGAGPQAYGACAFAVAAPGATVLAISPRASLSPRVAGWDRRHPQARRLDFTHRYGYGPDMVEAAARVFLLHDPTVAEDAMHAALYQADHITHLAMARVGGQPEVALAQTQLLAPITLAAMERSLTAAEFAQLWRRRRNYGPYLRALLAAVDAKDRPYLARMICENVTSRLHAPRFRKRLSEMQLSDDADL